MITLRLPRVFENSKGRRFVSFIPLVITGVATSLMTAIFIYREKILRIQIPVSNSVLTKEELKRKFNESYTPSDFAGIHVNRVNNIENEIKHYSNSLEKYEKIIVLVGQHGGGKSAMLNYCLKSEKAIIHLNIDHSNTMEEVGCKILNDGCEISRTLTTDISPLKVFEEACIEWKSQHQNSPTLIFDISPATKPETFLAVIRVAKRLACDSSCCGVFITLSTALLALLPISEIRLQYIYLPPYSIEEIITYFDILSQGSPPRYSRVEVERIHAEMGTTPYELRLIYRSKLSLDGFMKECRSNYITTLMNSLLDPSEFSSAQGMLNVYLLLIKKPVEEGALAHEVLEVSSISLKHIGYYMRSYQILDYHPGSLGSNLFGGYFYFRNSLIHSSAILLLKSPEYVHFIDTCLALERNKLPRE